MKVKELIKVLIVMDQESNVLVRSNDQGEFEYDGRVTGVSTIDFEDKSNQTPTKEMKGKSVVVCFTSQRPPLIQINHEPVRSRRLY